MARYNTVVSSTSTSTASATIASPSSGAFTEFTSSTNAVTIGDPALFAGSAQTFFNNTAGTVTLTSGGSGQFIGPGGSSSSTFSMATGTVLTVISDGAYWVVNGPGIGPHAVTSLTASGAVTLNPASANVTISPSGTGTVTINPAAPSSINNTSIGTTTAAAAAFTTLSASSTVSGTGFSTYLASPPAIGGSAAAAGSFTTLTATGTTTVQQLTEKIVAISGANGTTTHDWSTGDVFYLSSIGGNFVPNFTNVPATTLRSFTMTLILAQGGTPYIPTSIQVNSVGFSINWAGGVQPSGRANKIDVVSLFITNVSGTYVCLGSLSSYG